MAEQHTQTRVLRVFGPSTAQVSAVLREAAAKGCPGLRLLGKDGEFAVCITARTATPAAAEALCGEWEKTLRARLGAAVFAVGERSLPQAALDALLAEGLLLAAADAMRLAGVDAEEALTFAAKRFTQRLEADET